MKEDQENKERLEMLDLITLLLTLYFPDLTLSKSEKLVLSFKIVEVKNKKLFGLLPKLFNKSFLEVADGTNKFKKQIYSEEKKSLQYFINLINKTTNHD